MKYLESTGLNR